jgi:hypothetical protein
MHYGADHESLIGSSPDRWRLGAGVGYGDPPREVEEAVALGCEGHCDSGLRPLWRPLGPKETTLACSSNPWRWRPSVR